MHIFKNCLLLLTILIQLCPIEGIARSSQANCAIDETHKIFLKNEFDRFVKKYIPRGRSAKSPSAVAIYQSNTDGQIISTIYSRNANNPQPVASTQKIITAYVAYRLNYLNTSVTLTREDYNSYPSPSKLPLLKISETQEHRMQVGDRTTIGKLLYPLLSYQSNNQAAHAIARVIAERERTSFGQLMRTEMNRVLRKSNATPRSSFIDPSGLSPNQYSTADNMARFLSYILNDDEFRQELVEQGFSSLKNNYSQGLFGRNRGEFHKSGTTQAAGKTWVAHVVFDDPRGECKNNTSINYALFGAYLRKIQVIKFQAFVNDTIRSLQISLSEKKDVALQKIQAIHQIPLNIPKKLLVNQPSSSKKSTRRKVVRK